MNCNKAKNLILLRSTGELRASKSSELQEHLLECTDCRDFAASLRRLESIEQPVAATPHPSVLVNIREVAEKNVSRHSLLWLPSFPLRAAAYAAIFMLIAGPAFMVHRKERAKDERIANVHIIVALMAAEENSDENETALPDNEKNIEEMARRLLEFEGLDNATDDEAFLSLFEVPAPTTSLSRNTPAPRV